MYMPTLTIISFYNNCTFGSNFTCFRFKIVFLKEFLDRSASFFGQETHEHVKIMKKRCLEAQMTFFHKNLFKNMFSLCFPPNSIIGSKTDFLIKLLDDSAWLCLEKLKNIFFQPKTLIFDQQSEKYQTNPKNIIKMHENTGFARVPCGPVDPCGTVKLKVHLPYVTGPWSPCWRIISAMTRVPSDECLSYIITASQNRCPSTIIIQGDPN